MPSNKEHPETVGKTAAFSSQMQPQKLTSIMSGKAFRKKITFIIGLASIFIGFFLLTLTNPEGNNWASILSPLLIIGGYIIVIIALLLKP
jgi:hypothetical protein